MAAFDLTVRLELKDVQATAAELSAAVGTALFEEGHAILADAQANYVPVDDGPLLASGHVTPPHIEDGITVVTIGFGGPAAPYALAVHEHLSPHSPRAWKVAEVQGHPVQFHPAGRGPKYLETPLNHAAHGMAERIAARVRELVKR